MTTILEKVARAKTYKEMEAERKKLSKGITRNSLIGMGAGGASGAAIAKTIKKNPVRGSLIGAGVGTLAGVGSHLVRNRNKYFPGKKSKQ